MEFIHQVIEKKEHVACLLQVLKHAFTYHWKIWTIPEVLELLHEAGFAEVHVWMRCMIVSSCKQDHAYTMQSECTTVNACASSVCATELIV